MAGRTRLYQQAKSPLIQGQSKYARPSWQPWLGATLLGWLLDLVVIAAVVFFRSTVLPDLASAIRLWPWALATLGGAMIGAVLAVALSTSMGWRRILLGATLVAALFGLFAWLVAASLATGVVPGLSAL